MTDCRTSFMSAVMTHTDAGKRHNMDTVTLDQLTAGHIKLWSTACVQDREGNRVLVWDGRQMPPMTAPTAKGQVRIEGTIIVTKVDDDTLAAVQARITELRGSRFGLV